MLRRCLARVVLPEHVAPLGSSGHFHGPLESADAPNTNKYDPVLHPLNLSFYIYMLVRTSQSTALEREENQPKIFEGMTRKHNSPLVCSRYDSREDIKGC